MNPITEQDTLSLIGLLQTTALFLWKEWARNMQLASISEDGRHFTIRGICPHCGHAAAFPTVTSIYEKKNGEHTERLVAAARCAACNGFILAILGWNYGMGREPTGWVYDTHYPLDKPSDSV